MVMDFVQGGDFFTLMRKFRRLPEDWVRIYVCEVIDRIISNSFFKHEISFEVV